jgi:hypothetical protein
MGMLTTKRQEKALATYVVEGDGKKNGKEENGNAKPGRRESGSCDERCGA